MADEYSVYVIECTAKTGRVAVHVGIAKNVEKRLEDHRAGRVKATRGRKIKWLAQSFPLSHGDALRLEIKLKKMTSQQKRAWAGVQNYQRRTLGFHWDLEEEGKEPKESQ